MVMHLQLAGYRATGKTTVARLVAERAGFEWVDTDREIEARAGRNISEIFAEQGEEAFRDLESAVIRQLAERTNLVVALGGGAVLRDENRTRLKASGRCVWLTASVDVIGQRMRNDPNSNSQRPSLTEADALSEIRSVLAARTPIYEGFADWTIATDDLTPSQVADRIWQWWSR